MVTDDDSTRLVPPRRAALERNADVAAVVSERQSTDFGVLLRRLRLAASLTQEELAERAQLSERAVRRLEGDPDRVPRLQTIRLLARALDLAPEERLRLLYAARPEQMQPETSAPSATFPRSLTLLLGREDDLAAVASLLDRHRLVTVTGTGGVGKTRLAVAVLEQLEDAFDRVAFVELAPLRDPAQVLGGIAAALAVPDEGKATLFDIVAGVLGTGRALLALDNMEHLLAAREVVLRLLASCPALYVLVTSREVLRVRGETVYRLEPLSLPQAEGEIEASAAVRLFLDRSAEAGARLEGDSADTAAVADICRHLDGLPLAIELAAAWTPMLSPRALLGRLMTRSLPLEHGPRDLPDRQGTMRECIAWSFDLLTPDEQALFRRLAVFVGSCTVDAAEAVCQDSGSGDRVVIDALLSLVDKSLIQVRKSLPGTEEPRFGMLETLREYASEELARRGEWGELRRRHAEYFEALSHREGHWLTGSEQADWLALMEREHDNLRAALSWSLESDGGLGQRIAANLWEFWEVHGHLDEGRRWLEAVLAAPGGDRALRSRVLGGAGNLAWKQGDFQRAGDLHEESLKLRRELGDIRGTAASLQNLGRVARRQSDDMRAGTLLEESLRLFREVNDSLGVAMVLNTLGLVAEHQGEYQRAKALYEESLQLMRKLAYSRGMAITLCNLGNTAERQGEYERAAGLYYESLRHWQEVGDLSGIAESLVGLATVAGHQEAHTRALRLLGAAHAILADVGTSPELPDRERTESVSRRAGALLKRDEYEAAWAAGAAMTVDEALTYAATELPDDGEGR